MLRSTYLAIRRLLVFLIGVTIVLAGIIMIVTPGPALIVIPLGLAVLATEFLWAKRLLTKLKTTIAERVGGDNAAARSLRRRTEDSPDDGGGGAPR